MSARFVEEWVTLVDKRTVAIILSDGWDTGEPASLGHVMARLTRARGG